MTAALQILFDALSVGSIYALAALGIALIFGVMRLVNFAHGDYISFCVFAMLVPSTDVMAVVFIGKFPAIVLIPTILLIGAGIAVASEVFVFRHLRNANPATMMISSFALGFIIQHVLLMLFSSRPKSIGLWPDLSLPVQILGARIPLLQLLTILITIAILFMLVQFLRRTQFGLEMRAAAENFSMARMLGVRANRVIMAAFAVSGMLAASIGLILATQTGTTDIRMGMSVMLVAFVSTVIGGLGSLPGAVISGFLIGGVSVLLQVFLPLDARPFRDAFVYTAVIACLLWRPQGLFAPRSAKERV